MKKNVLKKELYQNHQLVPDPPDLPGDLGHLEVHYVLLVHQAPLVQKYQLGHLGLLDLQDLLGLSVQLDQHLLQGLVNQEDLVFQQVQQVLLYLVGQEVLVALDVC